MFVKRYRWVILSRILIYPDYFDSLSDVPYLNDITTSSVAPPECQLNITIGLRGLFLINTERCAETFIAA